MGKIPWAHQAHTRHIHTHGPVKIDCTNEIWSISTRVSQTGHTKSFEHGINNDSVQILLNDKWNLVSLNKSQSRVDRKSHSVTELRIIPIETNQSRAQSSRKPQKVIYTLIYIMRFVVKTHPPTRAQPNKSFEPHPNDTTAVLNRQHLQVNRLTFNWHQIKPKMSITIGKGFKSSPKILVETKFFSRSLNCI